MHGIDARRSSGILSSPGGPATTNQDRAMAISLLYKSFNYRKRSRVYSWNPAIEATARIRLAYVIDRFSKTADRQTDGAPCSHADLCRGGTYNNVAYRSHANAHV